MSAAFVAVEQGNSNTIAAVWRDGSWLAEHRIVTRRGREAAEYAVTLGSHLPRVPEGADCVIASVVPDEIPALVQMCGLLGWRPRVVGRDLPAPIEARVSEPGRVGVDRLLTALGAQACAAGDLVVLDAGTATKVDHVAADGAFCGGVIAPGMHPMLRQLVGRCERLAAVDPSRPAAVIGRSTDAAVASGAYYGYLAMLEGLVARVRDEVAAPVTVVATGGVLAGFSELSAFVDIYEPRLTLRGIAEAWRTAEMT